jgi:hypothetical protein
MEGDDFEVALAALPEGYSEGIYEGRRYSVNDYLRGRACKTICSPGGPNGEIEES